MTQIDLAPGYIWLLVIVLGLGTFGLRLSFIQFHGWLNEFPPRVERGLEFIPAAILAALICSELFTLDGSVVGTVINVRVLAAGLAGIVAWRTDNMLATIGVGMGTLWILQLVVG